MALYTFDSVMDIPQPGYSSCEKQLRFSENHGVERPYLSLPARFHDPNTGRSMHSLGEIVLVTATQDEFSGVIFVGDDERHMDRYEKFLSGSGIPDHVDWYNSSFTQHIIAGERISEREFATNSVFRGITKRGRPSKNPTKYEIEFNDLIWTRDVIEFDFKPQQVRALAEKIARYRRPKK